MSSSEQDPAFSVPNEVSPDSSGEVNLSLPEFRAIPSASDALDFVFNEDSRPLLAGSQAPDFADGNVETAWITNLAVRKHWAQIEWHNLTVTVNRVVIDCRPQQIEFTPPYDFFDRNSFRIEHLTSVLPLELRIEVRSGLRWESVANTAQRDAFDKEGIAVFKFSKPLSNINALRVFFATPEESVAAFRELQIFGPEPVSSFSFRPKWQASWLWADSEPPCANFGSVRRYFRHIFHVENPAKSNRIVLLFGALDRGWIYLNGHEIAKAAYNGACMRPQLVRQEIDPALFREGSNVLAIMADDVAEDRRRRGVLAELWWQTEDGSIHRTSLDPDNTRILEWEQPGWKTNLQHPEEWSSATQIALPNQKLPWLFGEPLVPPFPEETVELMSAKLDPETPQAGDEYKLQLCFQVNHKLTSDYAVIMEWGRLGPVQPNIIDFRLGESFVSPEQGLPAGFSGQKNVTLRGIWPSGTPPFVYGTLRLCHSAGQATLSTCIGRKLDNAQNRGCIELSFGIPPKPKKGFPDVQVPSGGRLMVDGKFIAPVIFTTSLLTPGRYKEWAKGSVSIFRMFMSGSAIVSSDQENAYFDRFVENYELQAEGALAVNSDAMFIVLLSLDMPPLWTSEHPEDQIVLPNHRRCFSLFPADASHGFVKPTPNSPASLAIIESSIHQLVARLSQSDYAGSLLGFVFIHGRGGENYWGLDANMTLDERGCWKIPDRHLYAFGDVGEAARRNFSRWLKAKYQTDENLAEAWKMPGVRFPDVISWEKFSGEKISHILNWKDRPDDRFIFRDTVEEGTFYTDFVRFQNEARAELFLRAGKAVKDASKGRLITGGYLGYIVPALSNSPPATAQHSGHQAIQRLLESPYIDFLPSPNYYFFRRAGDPVMPMSAVDSVRLNGKLWINEFDARTYLSPIVPKTFTQEETRQVFRRDFGYAISKDQGWWWCEFPFHVGGRHAVSWYGDPELLSDIAIMRRIYDRYLELPHEPNFADCAILFDPEQAYYTDAFNPANTLGSANVNFLIPKLYKLGPAFDLYSQSDFNKLAENNLLDHYKVVLFINAYFLKDHERSLVEKKLYCSGRTVLWFYAPGFLKQDGYGVRRSIKSMEALIKMSGINRLSSKHALGLRWLEDNSIFSVEPWWEEGQIQHYGQEIGPVFYLDAAVKNGWQGLATLRLDGEDVPSRIAVAQKQSSHGTILYSALPDLPLQALDGIIRRAGVHSTTSRSGVLVWSNRHFLCVHAAKDEAGLELQVAKPVSWIEPFEGRLYGANTSAIRIDLPRGETKFFCLDHSSIWQDFCRQ